MIPNTRLDRYVAVKRHVCMVMAVPSQVCSEAIGEDGREAKLGKTKRLGGKGWCYFGCTYYYSLLLNSQPFAPVNSPCTLTLTSQPLPCTPTKLPCPPSLPQASLDFCPYSYPTKPTLSSQPQLLDPSHNPAQSLVNLSLLTPLQTTAAS